MYLEIGKTDRSGWQLMPLVKHCGSVNSNALVIDNY